MAIPPEELKQIEAALTAAGFKLVSLREAEGISRILWGGPCRRVDVRADIPNPLPAPPEIPPLEEQYCDGTGCLYCWYEGCSHPNPKPPTKG